MNINNQYSLKLFLIINLIEQVVEPKLKNTKYEISKNLYSVKTQNETNGKLGKSLNGPNGCCKTANRKFCLCVCRTSSNKIICLSLNKC